MMNTDPKLPNPYLANLLPLLGVIGLALAGFLIVAGLVFFGKAPPGALVPASLPLALFVLVAIIAALLGVRQARLGQEFLESGRPQVRWIYSAEEWAALREINWEEAKGSWQMPTGCLAFMIGLAGLMVGAGLAADEAYLGMVDMETLLSIAGGALAGALAGAAAGGLIGAVVALGNWLAAKQHYRQTTPGQVALSRQELFVLDQYVKIDGESTRLVQVEWEHDYPLKLLLTLDISRPRRSEQTWEIEVPERVKPEVEAFVQQMEESLAN